MPASRELEPPSYSSLSLLLSGAMSGALAKTVIAPMDRVKIVFQTDPARSFKLSSIWDFVRQIYSLHGITTFWKGHTATILRVAPYSATNFFVFERSRNALANVPSLNENLMVVRFLAGATSGSVAVCVTYPLETLRARMAVDLADKYADGYVRVVRNIIRCDGVRSLYSGLRPTLLGIVPYAGISFTVYETCKSEEMKHFDRFLVGAFAGIVAQSATYPLDVVRRRMQVDPKRYTSMLDTFFRVYRFEGVISGLYKGLSMNMIKGPLAVAISLNANDYIKRMFLENR